MKRASITSILLKVALVASAYVALAGAASAEPNRLQPVWDQSVREGRCAGVGIPPELCAQGQAKAVTDCGLNQTEQKFMRDNSILPMCFAGNLISVCTCGCFDSGTQIAVAAEDGVAWQAIETISARQKVVTVADEAALGSLAYRISGLRSVVSGPEETLLYAIQTVDGRKIALSQHHGVLLGDGTVTTAKELSIGQELVTQTGERVAIAKIERRPAKNGKVYNLLTDRDTKTGHLILANGFVVGDLQWQNSYGDQIGAIAIRQ